AVADDQQVKAGVVLMGRQERVCERMDAVIGLERADVDQVDAGERALAACGKLHVNEDRPRTHRSRDESGKRRRRTCEHDARGVPGASAVAGYESLPAARGAVSPRRNRIAVSTIRIVMQTALPTHHSQIAWIVNSSR